MSVSIYSILLISLAFHLSAQASEREYDYLFFDNSLLPGPYFHSSTTYEGGSYIKNIQGKLPVDENLFFTPPNSLVLDYENGDGSWEAGIRHERVRGQDSFHGSDFLSFWAHTGNTPDERLPWISLVSEKRQRRTRDYLVDQRSKPLPMAPYRTGRKEGGWSFVRIPLADFQSFEGRPNRIVFSNSKGKGSGKVYIDQLELLPDIRMNEMQEAPEISAVGYERHVDVIWGPLEEEGIKYVMIYRSEDNRKFEPIGIQHPYYQRYTDYTGEPGKTYHYRVSLLDGRYHETEHSNTVSATTRPMTEEELLDMVQEASFRYYWEGAEAHSGLALENIPGRKNMIATGASGFGIMALVVATERGFITREQAVGRMQRILAFLRDCDKYHGAVSHFYDGPTGKTEPFFGHRDNGGDLVETSFLFQGLLTARSYFNQDDVDEAGIRSDITRLWEGVEWDWYDREKEDKFLTWHWSPDQEWVIDHKLIGWNETMITYLLAMSSPTHPVPVSMYYNGWASREERAQQYRKNWGRTEDGSMYTNGNTYHGIRLPVGVANGGPLFFVHYSYMGMDPRDVTDRYTNYFDNNRRIALINWRYCTENPNNHRGFGEAFWGLTASDGPWGYRAMEPRADMDDGTMAPTGALASFPYTPEQSLAALKNLYRNHGRYLWGEYGFRDAVNLEVNWQAGIYMGLNQAPVTVMIENYRTGLVWEMFMKNAEVRAAVERLGEME